MIKSFIGSEAEKIWKGIISKKIDQSIQNVIRRKLVMIDSAEKIETLRFPPGNHLEFLKGDRKGQFSIRVNNKYRICFNWHDGNALNVEVVDYH